MDKSNHVVAHFTDEWPTGLKTADEISEQVKGAIPAARIIELADAGYAPHYRIDGGAPLFLPPEIKRWMAKNLLQRRDGASLLDAMRVVVAAPPVQDMPPKSIRNIGALRQMPSCEYEPGVYFLCDGDDVVYVGQSVQPTARIATHVTTKTFDRAYLLPVPPSELNEVEGAFIRVLTPRLNGGLAKGYKIVAPSITRDPNHTVSSFRADA